MKQYKHIPTGNIYKLNGAGGIIRVDCSTNSSLPLWIVENSKDWEEVKQPEFTILSFKDNYGKICNNVGIGQNYYDDEFDTIWSVRRESDGEIFTIDDKVVFNNKHYFTIEKFYFDCNNNHLLCSNKAGTGHINICKILKAKKLFTTEDGVDIFNETDDWWIVYIPGYTGSRLSWEIYKNDSKLSIWFSDPGIKRFSTKQAAEEYILFNKPCLSINSLHDFWKSKGWSGIGTFGHYNKNELETFVKSKL